jgi:cation diffusion facilitator CzcD-associated flavoprotein CzcO
MNCQPTKTPPLDDMDIPALRERYAMERSKRFRSDAGEQFVRSTDDFASVYEADPHMPVLARAAIAEQLDVAILGGGWTGLLAGYHLAKSGISGFRHLEHGGDFGGVWYWNRYPGIQCDNDAYCYLPLLEETGFMPSKKFEDGWEIQQYCRLIAEKYGFYDKALFHTRVTALRWQEETARWRVETNRGDVIDARFVTMAGGLMNMPKLPGIPGIRDFKGKMFHSARWDYDYTGGEWRNPVLSKLADKRVAIVGTGATSIQAVPFLGQHAKQLYVLQRTPSTIDERSNPPTDPDWARMLEPGWQKERQDNYHRGAMENYLRTETDRVCDIWTEIGRNLHAELVAEGWPDLTPEEHAAKREVVDYRVMERIRRRVASQVEDPATAEALKPYFRLPCKRPLSNNEYFPTFNRPNVKLIDVSATKGVERMTEKGFVADGVEYEVDCMIFASGFEVTSDLERRWGIDVVEGREGRSIYDHWAEGPSTLHGVMTHGFPNMFFTGYIQGGLNASTTEQFNRQDEHIAYIIGEALARGAGAVEPSHEAQEQYCRHFDDIAADVAGFLSECPPSYYANDGDIMPRWVLLRGYGHGWTAFQKLLADWRQAGDLDGMLLSGPIAAKVAG